MRNESHTRIINARKATPTNEKLMKKADIAREDLRPEYDCPKMQGGIRGKYVQRYCAGTNLVKIGPDVEGALAR